MLGGAAIPAQWADPIDNRLTSSIPDCDQIKFTDLAVRTHALV
jgi:hypothetical protein